MQSPAQPGPRWSRILVLVVALSALLEVSFRIGIWRWAGVPYHSLAPYRWSAYGLVRSNPELSSPAFQIDKNGFRDVRDYTREKPARTLRVMILGGSTMYSGIGGVVAPGFQRVDSRSTIASYLEADLRADPELSGLDIQVMNAAVNFNSIVEVAEAYIAEDVFYEPDIVVVGGSANNFMSFMPRGATQTRSWGLMGPHPWKLEFERVVNRRSALSAAENVLLSLEHASAAVAVSKKAASALLDIAASRVIQLAASLDVTPHESSVSAVPADFSEFDDYLKEYFGYADAIVAVARRHDQEVAFFWEHDLQDMEGRKPFSETEKWLYAANVRPTHRWDRLFDDYARGALAEYCRRQQVSFVDPLDALRTHADTVYIDYLHYTREGNAFMAGVVDSNLKEIVHARARRLRQAASP